MATKPIKLIDPWITLGTTPGTSVKCFSHGIHLVPEEDDALATFCDPQGFSWLLSLDLLMSEGVGSLEEALIELGPPGTIVPFEFAYMDDVAAVENPHWTGEVRLPAWPVVDAEISEPTDFTLEMEVIGDISRDDGAVTTVLFARQEVHSAKGKTKAAA